MPYAGLTVESLAPNFDLTNSLLMNKPVGWSYLRPLGAVRETITSLMVPNIQNEAECDLSRGCLNKMDCDGVEELQDIINIQSQGGEGK
jgi:hypothetical protein